MALCTSCGNQVEESASFCTSCGKPMPAAAQPSAAVTVARPVCSSCGAQADPGSVFCTECGKRLDAQPASVDEAAPAIAVAAPPAAESGCTNSLTKSFLHVVWNQARARNRLLYELWTAVGGRISQRSEPETDVASASSAVEATQPVASNRSLRPATEADGAMHGSPSLQSRSSLHLRLREWNHATAVAATPWSKIGPS